jgi:hypothetical protein
VIMKKITVALLLLLGATSASFAYGHHRAYYGYAPHYGYGSIYGYGGGGPGGGVSGDLSVGSQR